MKANFRVFAKKYISSIHFFTAFTQIFFRISSPIIIRVVLTFITKWKQTEEELAEVERFEKDHKKELTDLRQMDNWHGQVKGGTNRELEFGIGNGLGGSSVL
jgi:hypothetical protein